MRSLEMRALVALVASLLLIACPGNRRGEDESRNAPPQTSTTTSNPQAVPERSAKMNPIMPPSTALPSATKQIQVQLTEYEIQIPGLCCDPARTESFARLINIAGAGWSGR